MIETNAPAHEAEAAIELVAQWLRRADELETKTDRATLEQLEGVVTDDASVRFVMAFVDRVVRPDDDAVAAAQLASVVSDGQLPGFLTAVDRLLLRAGARLGPAMPSIVMPLARRRMRAIVGHLVAPAEPARLAGHLATQRAGGWALNVNLLGEAVLGEREAARRLDELLDLLGQPDVDYVSAKISAVASQLNHWAHDDSLRRVSERLAQLMDRAATVSPPTFVNVDMEEYHDLELTMQAFMDVLGAPERHGLDAGIVLQAYLPDALPALQRLVEWANERHAAGGGTVKVRLVKGANLAMERVDAAMHGWEQAPYERKVDADANYKRCVDWLLHRERMAGVRLGLASHNLFDIAWTHLLADARGVRDRVQYEMLQGMAPAQAATVAEASEADAPVLLYTPAVRSEDFDVAISYLFRRLEENAADDNFLRHLFDLEPGGPSFRQQADVFRASLDLMATLPVGRRRTQNRMAAPVPAYVVGEPFRNEPETDPTGPENQEWIDLVRSLAPGAVKAPLTDTLDGIDHVLDRARASSAHWRTIPAHERQRLLHRVGDELAARRGELIAAMLHEGHKTFAEADGEVAEAIDFARYYGDRALELEVDGRTFAPFGVVGVIPPWNFPVAIPTGGVTSALAAGNSVIFKPAPETPRCAEIVVEACHAAGVPDDVLQFVRTPDDEVGRQLVTSVDAVILTGSSETADLFRSWKPDLRLFAETSGKNALIITPNADLDLAVADLVQSAFGHSGQKCSAASLAVLVGDVGRSDRFRRQLVDAVESIELGPSAAIETTMGPLIGPANDRLDRAFTTLDSGERWLVEPRNLGDNLWSPGVRDEVQPGAWFHRTECFGPVLGLIHVPDLDAAIELVNSSEFGLTGGIHTLDPGEVERWMERVEVGNAYVNRPITGAIVQRQPFGGWKRSSIGPGAKAGGPNYVQQLGAWQEEPTGGDDFAVEWERHFSQEHDPTGLFCEANVFRYRALARVGVWFGPEAEDRERRLVHAALHVVGSTRAEPGVRESLGGFAERLGAAGVERIRVVGATPSDADRRAAATVGVHLATEPVSRFGRLELLHYVREQAVTRTLHRFGNLLN